MMLQNLTFTNDSTTCSLHFSMLDCSLRRTFSKFVVDEPTKKSLKKYSA